MRPTPTTQFEVQLCGAARLRVLADDWFQALHFAIAKLAPQVALDDLLVSIHGDEVHAESADGATTFDVRIAA